MADPGSFAEKVKTQADIVRIVGDYVRLKKSGQNFMGLCPFHSEKSPSFSVHPVKQFYHCFGCGVSGDVFKFIMEVEKCEFPEAVNTVAEKAGIPIPKPKPRSPAERAEQQQRPALVEMHRDAAMFFRKQLEDTPEGRAARAYLEDRGVDAAALAHFGIGYAPSSGEALLRALRGKFSPKLLEISGLVGRDGQRMYDRFRRRIMFPVANERGQVIAFGGRALGDDLPKYLNSPETPIYRKSSVLYNIDRAKTAIREAGFAVLVEGYMDAIAVARAGVSNVVASCGTALTVEQVKLLNRFAQGRVVVNFDPDAAGQTATERSLALLVEQGFEVRVLVLPAASGDKKAADPDLYIRQQGAEAYRGLLKKAPPYIDYLIGRARAMDTSSAEGKLRAINFLMPYVQRVPDSLLRSEWATRIASQLQIDEPVLRESLRRAAADRRGEVKPRPELISASAKPAERRLIQMLIDADNFRKELAQIILKEELYQGIETQKIFAALVDASKDGARPEPAVVADYLEERDRRVLFEIAFDAQAEMTWEEAESCLNVLRRRRVDAELAAVQKEIEAKPAAAELRKLLARKQELRSRLKEPVEESGQKV